MVERFVGPGALDDGERLGEPVDPHLRWVVREPERLVVGLHPARAEPELEASFGEQVDGRGLLGGDRGVLVIVAEDEHPDPQLLGDAAAKEIATIGAISVSMKWSGTNSVE